MSGGFLVWGVFVRGLCPGNFLSCHRLKFATNCHQTGLMQNAIEKGLTGTLNGEVSGRTSVNLHYKYVKEVFCVNLSQKG